MSAMQFAAKLNNDGVAMMIKMAASVDSNSTATASSLAKYSLSLNGRNEEHGSVTLGDRNNNQAATTRMEIAHAAVHFFRKSIQVFKPLLQLQCCPEQQQQQQQHHHHAERGVHDSENVEDQHHAASCSCLLHQQRVPVTNMVVAEAMTTTATALAETRLPSRDASSPRRPSFPSSSSSSSSSSPPPRIVGAKPSTPLTFIATEEEATSSAVSEAPRTTKHSHKTAMSLKNEQGFTCIDCAILLSTDDMLSQTQTTGQHKCLILISCAAAMINVGIISHRLYSWCGLPTKKREGYANQAKSMYRNALKCLGSAQRAVSDHEEDGHHNTTTHICELEVIAANNLAVLCLARRDIDGSVRTFSDLRSLLFAKQQHVLSLCETNSTADQEQQQQQRRTSTTPQSHANEDAHPQNRRQQQEPSSLFSSAWMKGVLLNVMMSRDISHYMSAAAAA